MIEFGLGLGWFGVPAEISFGCANEQNSVEWRLIMVVVVVVVVVGSSST